jgi:hypothetical protein
MVDGIPVTCPSCHKDGVVPLSYAGKGIHCRACGVHFIVPQATPAPAAAGAAPAPPEAASVSAAAALLDDEVGLAPLSPEEERHCRERYEGRTRLSKDRSELQHDPDYEREVRHHSRSGDGST